MFYPHLTGVEIGLIKFGFFFGPEFSFLFLFIPDLTGDPSSDEGSGSLSASSSSEVT